ncbi:MAG: peptide chain release factor N(5)-glutamine methyltransferase [Gemmatimonadetes bacterium]|jgi:release factor glutamine methyltransferase|nr:peptide chain release factor N(5)-glutamine methyltransferase [Gemmatimonadota bacterium]
MQKRSWKLLDILNETSGFFASREIENPRLQAELLLADVLEVRRLDLYLQFERLLTPEEVDGYREHVKKRVQRVPLQYITGEAGFRELTLVVREEVLIPRPETEILVEIALEFLSSREEPLVLDLGCGSGAIALALASEHATARLVGIDLSAEALAVARENAERSEMTERVEMLCGDLFAPLRERAEQERFDAIVSNPPYVRSGDIAELEAEVREYEPHLALDGGEDGLDCYRRIAREAGEFLEPEGCLFLEVGDGQAEAVSGLLAAEGCFENIETRSDLNDVPRVVTARFSATRRK